MIYVVFRIVSCWNSMLDFDCLIFELRIRLSDVLSWTFQCSIFGSWLAGFDLKSSTLDCHTLEIEVNNGDYWISDFQLLTLRFSIFDSRLSGVAVKSSTSDCDAREIEVDNGDDNVDYEDKLIHVYISTCTSTNIYIYWCTIDVVLYSITEHAKPVSHDSCSCAFPLVSCVIWRIYRL